MAAPDVWELSSGLVDDFDGTVVDAFFSRDKGYNNGDTAILKLVVKADEINTFPEDNTTTLIYPVGNDWEPIERGAAIEHESGAPKQFRRSSGIGELVHAARELGLVDVWRENGGSPFSAEIWKGLHASWHNQEFDYTNRKTGEKRAYYRMLPVELIEGPAKPEEIQAEEKQASENLLELVDPADKGVLKAIAVASANHDAFLEAAMTADREWPAEVEALVMNPEFYTALKADG